MGRKKTNGKPKKLSIETQITRLVYVLNSGKAKNERHLIQKIAELRKQQASKPKKRIKQVITGWGGFRRGTSEEAQAFYGSQQWRQIRFKALVKHGSKCVCCGASPETGAIMHADHIKPRSKYPELELQFNNLQILCADCNLGKSNLDETDLRPVIE